MKHNQDTAPDSPTPGKTDSDIRETVVSDELTLAEQDAMSEAGASEGAAAIDTTPDKAKAVSAGDAKSDARSEGSDARNESKSIARSAGIVSIAVMGSRLLGLVREQVMAKYFGAGFLTDAFVVAFRIPNLLRDLFAEGALSAAFVTTFTAYSLDPKKGDAAAWRLANMVMNLLVIILSVITILGIVFAPYIVAFMTMNFDFNPNTFQLTVSSGFSPEKAALATTLTRIMFPFLLAVAVAAVAMGVLNTKKVFGIPASASTMFNVGSIIGGIGFAYLLSGGGWISPQDPAVVPSRAAQLAIMGMGIGTLIGGVLQFAIQVPALRRVGFRYQPILSLRDEGVRQVMKLMAPAVIGTAAVQINVMINTMFASDISGAPSWLTFAFRLMQFPIGVFGVAIGTATLPAISRFAKTRDMDNFRETLASSISLVFLLTLPSACGLIVLGQPIIKLIYERGAFTGFDTQMTATALAAYSIGLTGYAAIKVLSPAFYALGDARTPMVISLLSIVTNIVANLAFKNVFASFQTALAPNGYAHVGLAFSTSCVALINFFALLFLMRRKVGNIHARRILSSFARTAVAACALSITSYALYRLLLNALGDATLYTQLILTLLPIACGAAVFFAVARLLRIRELEHAVNSIAGRFRRKR